MARASFGDCLYHIISPEIKFQGRNSHRKKTTSVTHQGHTEVRIPRNSYYLPLKFLRERKGYAYLFG